MSSTAISSSRPASRILSTLLAQTPAHHGLITLRSHQLASRTKRALRIRPHATHLLRKEDEAVQDEIVFNPPAAIPTVYNTPFKFLPRTDPRRLSNLQVLFAQQQRQVSQSRSQGDNNELQGQDSPQQQQNQNAAAAAFAAASVNSLPMVGHNEEKRYHITPDQVREMRALRSADPRKWSLNKLATKFDCSVVFVGRATTAPKDHIKQMLEGIEMRRARWGAKRLKAKEDAKKRKDMLFRGEI